MRPRWYCSFSFSTFIIFFLFAWHTHNVLLMCATIALTILCPLKIRTLSSTLTLHFPAQGDWASKSSKRSNASIPKDESKRDCHRLCGARRWRGARCVRAQRRHSPTGRDHRRAASEPRSRRAGHPHHVWLAISVGRGGGAAGTRALTQREWASHSHGNFFFFFNMQLFWKEGTIFLPALFQKVDTHA